MHSEFTPPSTPPQDARRPIAQIEHWRARDDAPRVSIVLPTYMRAEMLDQAIATVLAQTFEDWELFIVDDNGVGSPEQRKTAEIASHHTSDPRITYVPHARNLGGGAARNTGIRLARGDFVAFIDDDDAWYPEKLALQVDHLDASSRNTALVYGGFRQLRGGGTAKTFRPRPDGHTLSHLLRRNTVGPTSLVLCRREALLDVEGFDEALPARQDIDLYVRLSRGHAFTFVDDIILDKLDHDASAIGKDAGATAEAHGLFYRKYYPAYEQDPSAHRDYLVQYAEKLLAIDDLAGARRLYGRAWRLDGRALRALGLALFARRPWWHPYLTLRKTMRRKRVKGAVEKEGTGPRARVV